MQDGISKNGRRIYRWRGGGIEELIVLGSRDLRGSHCDLGSFLSVFASPALDLGARMQQCW
ncbi:hypothetical protein BER93_06180 [Xanthomonas fragariae]|nr:hypothetical protein BER92_06170 [Xanthomonas fragariae]AOD17778.1 hypothetical protein BER93_06180 [Xanthomonas fragariae]